MTKHVAWLFPLAWLWIWAIIFHYFPLPPHPFDTGWDVPLLISCILTGIPTLVITLRVLSQ